MYHQKYLQLQLSNSYQSINVWYRPTKTQGGPLQCSLEPQQGEDPEEGTKEGPLPATYRSITQVLKLKINSHWAPYGVGSIIKSATCQSTLQLSYRTYHREVISSFAEID